MIAQRSDPLARLFSSRRRGGQAIRFYPFAREWSVQSRSSLKSATRHRSTILPYRLLADLVVMIHLAFVVFAVLGGLLVLRWRRIAWVHLPAICASRRKR